MKKFILLLLLFPAFVFSQVKFSNYYNPYNKETYNISIEKPNKKGVFAYWVECQSLDSKSKESVLFIYSDKTQDFLDYLKFLKDIFIKWSETAKANNVTEISKEIEYKSKNYTSAFSYGSWHIDLTVQLKARFKNIGDKFYVIINSGELKSATNQFIKSDGFVFTFEKESDFDDLINKFKNEEALKMLNESQAKEDLFKN